MSKVGAIDHQISLFLEALRNRDISGPRTVAVATANMLMRFVSSRRYQSSEDLAKQVKELGSRIVTAQPHEFTAGNVVRRVLKSIRTVDEAMDFKQAEQDDSASAMFGLLTTPVTEKGPETNGREEKGHVMDEIQQILDEIQNDDPLFKSGFEMINDGDILLIPCPGSETVVSFLTRAAQKLRFQVLLTECYPNYSDETNKTAEKLEKAGIPTTLVPDTAVYAIMSRVCKVIISCRAVLANGGCITSTGINLACQAAQEFKKPVLAMAGSYKLSQLYPFDIDTLIEIGNSSKVVDFADPAMEKLEVINPIYDYVAPEMINIIITTDGTYSTNFVYRLILDNYCSEDQDPLLREAS